MAMTLRVVIPPHPLIGHWLSILRMDSTPPPIYAIGLEQIGKWLTYEAIREWIPFRKEELITSRGKSEGILVDSSVPIMALPNIPGGLQLWQGARELLPNATLCLGETPEKFQKKAGVLIYCDEITNAERIIKILNKLEDNGVTQAQTRVITAVTSSQGLKNIGERFSDLTIYSACIDENMTEDNELIPGIGDPIERLNTRITGPN